MNRKKNLPELFDQIFDHWSPKVVGEVNDHLIKISKIQGEFLWHNHKREDEMFMVVKGEMEVQLRDEIIPLTENEIFVVARGVDHNLRAKEECWLLILEKARKKD
ncbi:cupin domain-containing protein [Prolixibacteraceae bacterium JC049]|nr:cupin domain-containing protein [Prolixibacteraceae bacterium JC049]